jgi:uncharacterized protein YeaO (DUF488 family)
VRPLRTIGRSEYAHLLEPHRGESLAPVTGSPQGRPCGEASRPSRVGLRWVHDPPTTADGTRIFVDRIWPRGLAQTAARLDHWIKDVAPSSPLNTWLVDDPARFAEFARRYHAELASPPARYGWLRLWRLAGYPPVTLVTTMTDLAHSPARVLADLLAVRFPNAGDTGPDSEPGRESGGDPACWTARGARPAAASLTWIRPPAAAVAALTSGRAESSVLDRKVCHPISGHQPIG